MVLTRSRACVCVDDMVFDIWIGREEELGRCGLHKCHSCDAACIPSRLDCRRLVKGKTRLKDRVALRVQIEMSGGLALNVSEIPR